MRHESHKTFHFFNVNISIGYDICKDKGKAISLVLPH